MHQGRFLICIFCMAGQIAFAQLTERDTARWQIMSNFSLKFNQGNVERIMITPEVNITHLNSESSFGFSARQRYTYGTFGKFTTERDLLLRNFIYAYPNRKVYPYLMAWFQTHELQRLLFRYQIGPGLTFLIVRSGATLIKLSGTATYEENFYSTAGLTLMSDGVKHYDVFRGTGRIFGNHTIISEMLYFSYECLFQQALNSKENWRVFSETSLTMKISGNLSIRSYLNYEYQTVYIEGRKPQDLVFNIAINYQKHFNHKQIL